jgi:hypothetical protein
MSKKRKPKDLTLPRSLRGKSLAQIDAIADEFDQEFVESKSKPASAKEQARFERARRRGRPPVGEGAEKIRISVERSLLRRTDAAARRIGASRSELIALALAAVVSEPLPLTRQSVARAVARAIRQVA